MLIGGYDDKAEKFELYFVDYLGSLVKVPFASHGYGGYFSIALMDRYHREGMTNLYYDLNFLGCISLP